MHKKYKRPILIIVLFLFGISGGFIVIKSISNNMVFFYNISEMEKVSEGKVIKIAGYVKPNTITLMDESHMEFVIMDIKDKDIMVKVMHKGPMPTKLFKDGQMVVLIGQKRLQKFYSDYILVKHDENYKIKGEKCKKQKTV